MLEPFHEILNGPRRRETAPKQARYQQSPTMIRRAAPAMAAIEQLLNPRTGVTFVSEEEWRTPHPAYRTLTQSHVRFVVVREC